MAIDVFPILFRSGNYILIDDFSKSEAATVSALKSTKQHYDLALISHRETVRNAYGIQDSIRRLRPTLAIETIVKLVRLQ